MPHPAFCALLYLLDVTRSVRPAQAVSPASPRSFASWKREERQLVQILLNADIPTERVAQMIERTEEAVDYQQEGRNDRKATTSSLEHLPQTVVALCEADIELLINWQPLPLRDPLAWRYGLPFDPAFLKPAAQPTLRVITVQPDPALALPLPDPEAYGYWAASRQDQANTARATWIDLAAKLTAIGGQVILHAPDPHQSRQLAVRAAIKRHAGESAPRNSVRQSGKATAQVVLLDQPERWPVGQIAALSAQTVIVVLPSLQLPEGSLPFGSGPPADMAAAWTRLPLLLRRPDGCVALTWPAADGGQG